MHDQYLKQLVQQAFELRGRVVFVFSPTHPVHRKNTSDQSTHKVSPYMLEDYEEFVAMLKHCGGVACGTTSIAASCSSALSVQSSTAASPAASSSSSLRGWYVAAVATSASEARVLCGSTALPPSGGGAGGGGTPVCPVDPSLQLAMMMPLGATSSTKDTVVFVVSEACVANSSSVLCGALTYDMVRDAHQDIPLSVLVPLLYNAIRSTIAPSSSTVSRGGGGGQSQHDASAGNASSMLVTIDTHTKRLVLAIDIRGALRRQLVVPLSVVDAAERRRNTLGFVTTSLMVAHTAAMGQVEREKRSRQEAEERLSRAQAQLADRGTGGKLLSSSEEGGQHHSTTHGTGRLQKPASFLNPQQKGPTKRPRGVKLN